MKQDRAITSSDEDLLDRAPFIESLFRALVTDERNEAAGATRKRATGLVVGLTGRWGLGKSSVIALLKRRLEAEPGVAVISLNPWLFKGRDELVAAFFNGFHHAVGKTTGQHAKDLVRAVQKYRSALEASAKLSAAAIDMHGGLGAASAVVRIIGAIPKLFGITPPTPDEERKGLERKIKESHFAIVVLIDELDRVEDDEVRAIAQLVKAIGDIQGVSYLVAYDPARVADALGRGTGDARTKSGEAYLEKIIQHPIPLRPFIGDDVRAFFLSAMKEQGLPDFWTEATGAAEKIRDFIADHTHTPRDIKRLVGSYAVLNAATNQEIEPMDLLGYCWVLTKSPSARDVIASEPDKFIDDPSEREMIRRVSNRVDGRSKVSLKDEFGISDERSARLLGYLFPRFGSEAREDVNRIARRRNLYRALYLGDPPGQFTKADVVRLWTIRTAAQTEMAIGGLQREEKLGSFLDRLEDLLPELSPEGDVIFWVSLSRMLRRDHDWATGAEPDRSIAQDASTLLFRFGLQNSTTRERAKLIITALIASGDLAIWPHILRRHYFRYGLVVSTPARDGEAIFTPSETSVLASQETTRIREAIASGEYLRREISAEPMFAIANIGKWDDNLRGLFTEQLRSPQAFETFASLVVPPGFGVERSTLDILFDANEISREVLQPAFQQKLSGDPWLSSSVNRLKRVLAGKDATPLFEDDEEP